MGTVRFSTGRTTTEAEIDLAIEVVAEAVARLQAPQAAAAPADVQQGEEIRLTRFTHGMGCACKLRPQELEVVLRSLPRPASADVLVDASTADDAAAYRLSGELAIVQTVDFFTPIADDPFDFGAISAANSLSDIYAMGARPLFALSIVGFPSRRLPLSVLARILEGAAAKAREAGIDIVGGHSVEDTEPKFGLAVTGAVHPRRILTNRGAQPGDALILTKPVGTGIIMTAAKLQLASGGVVESALETMRSLNRAAAEALAPFDVHALTDVTGFGLLGHLREMTVASGVNAELRSSDVPLLSGALDFATAGGASGGTVDNLAHVSPHVDWTSTVARGLRLLLADAQTSGGLLIAVAPGDAEPLLGALLAAGVASARRIGAIAEKGAGRIRVLE
ncbi:MAG: selenide, water dikinase SelD [Planctomycetes bacterium]|nr:selenide, water dikinase SelD [Planctomycetota bacterium]